MNNIRELSETDLIKIGELANLTWQQSGKANCFAYDEAGQFIADLNAKKLSGYSAWRLPSLDEVATLLYVDVPDQTRRWVWMADSNKEWLALVSYFCDDRYGTVHIIDIMFVQLATTMP